MIIYFSLSLHLSVRHTSNQRIVAGMLLTEDDAKKVAKMMENQISGLTKDREAAKLEASAEARVKSTDR